MIRPILEALEAEAGLLGPLEEVVRDVTRMVERYADMDPVHPPVNVSANEDTATVVLELPGVQADSLDLEVKDNVLSVSGERVDPHADAEVNYIRRERQRGPFRRSVRLPFDVEVDAVTATYRDGLLTVTLPRAEASKPRKIVVEG